jgi:hypothetical protein
LSGLGRCQQHFSPILSVIPTGKFLFQVLVVFVSVTVGCNQSTRFGITCKCVLVTAGQHCDIQPTNRYTKFQQSKSLCEHFKFQLRILFCEYEVSTYLHLVAIFLDRRARQHQYSTQSIIETLYLEANPPQVPQCPGDSRHLDGARLHCSDMKRSCREMSSMLARDPPKRGMARVCQMFVVFASSGRIMISRI